MKLSIQIVLFLVFFNAGAGMIQATAVSDDLGISPETGEPDELQEAQDQADKFSAGGGLGDTLFGLISALGTALNTIVNAIFPGAAMLKNVGIPDPIVNFLFSGMTLYVAFDMMDFLRTGGLT